MFIENVSVGVIIPYCNDFHYIKECLTSIDKQTALVDINVYIIDDCSDDSIRLHEFIKEHEFEKIRLTYFRNDLRLGGGESRNIGIRLCSDVYISFMDADDFWVEEKLEVQLSEYIEGTVQCAKSRKGAIFNDSVILPKYVKRDNESVSEALFCSNKLLQTSTFFMAASIAKNICFNPKLPRHQDYDFLLRAEYNGYPIIQIDKPLSFWRVIDDNTNRFLKKNATAEFFIDWFLEYRKYMSVKARVAYCAKNIFSACFVTKKFSLYFRFLVTLDDSIYFKLRVIVGIFTWRLTKLWRRLF